MKQSGESGTKILIKAQAGDPSGWKPAEEALTRLNHQEASGVASYDRRPASHGFSKLVAGPKTCRDPAIHHATSLLRQRHDRQKSSFVYSNEKSITEYRMVDYRACKVYKRWKVCALVELCYMIASVIDRDKKRKKDKNSAYRFG